MAYYGIFRITLDLAERLCKVLDNERVGHSGNGAPEEIAAASIS